MPVQGRVNNIFGGGDSFTITATSAGTVTIPENATWINLTAASGVTLGSASVPVFSLPSWARGRVIVFYNSGSQIITLTNTDTSSMASTTTNGFIDLGGSNRAMDPTDLVCVYVRDDGSAIRVFSTLDN